MRLAIMQPYFLPYIGYWQLFSYADAFILFDVVPFKKRSWMCRNRILHPDASKEFSYINLPVTVMESKRIPDVRVELDNKWCKSLFGSLSLYQRMRAPHYNTTIEYVRDMCALPDRNFNAFIKAHIEAMLMFINIDCPIHLASELDIDFSGVNAPGEWALTICQALEAKSYVNPVGGAAIFDERQYTNEDIALEFLKPNLTPYSQGKRTPFIPGLSILDQLMFCGSSGTNEMIRNDFQIMSQAKLLSGVEAN